MAIFSATDREWLRSPHVARAWFGCFDLPSGESYLHNGVGRWTISGQEYRGVTDPVGGQLVAISSVEDPRFGQAAKIDITIGGVDAQFFRSVKDDARDLEGRDAIISFAVFDPETLNMRVFRSVLPGKMTAPALFRKGVSERYIVIGIEGFWQSQNYPFGGRWTDGDQRRRFPGDKGLMFAGQKVAEQWR